MPFEGGATAFADCRYAYRTLSPEAQEAADEMTVQYWEGGVFGRTAVDVTGGDYPQMEQAGLRPLHPPDFPTAPPTEAELAEEKARMGLSTFKSKEGLSDIITRRWVEEKPGGSAMLVQETSFQNIRYRRSFRRVTG